MTMARQHALWRVAAVVIVVLLAAPASAFDIEGDLLEQTGEDRLAWVEDYTTYGDGRVKLSGSVRNRVESRDDWDFDSSVGRDYLDETWGLFRVRLRADVQAHENLLLVGELQSSHAYELDNNNAASVRRGGGAVQDRLDIFQAYAEVKNLADIEQLTVRAGRYALVYGQERLVGAFGWSNVGRSFEGGRVAWEEENWWLHAFYNNVVTPFDGHANQADSQNTLAGVYMQYHGYDWGKTEAYWLLHLQDNAGGVPTADGREIHTFGTRFEARLPQNDAIDVDGEFAYQDGELVDGVDHQAFALHLGGGYTFQDVAWTPRVGAMYNFATGDEDPTDMENETFDNLFPTNHLHYGYMDRFSWQNMHNIQLGVSAKPYKSLTLKLDWHYFLLDEPDNAPWMIASGAPIRGPLAGADDDFGHEIDFTLKWSYYKHFEVQTGYSHFFAGDYLDDTSLGLMDDDADWWYVQTTLKF